jgi:hypothetical protein
MSAALLAGLAQATGTTGYYRHASRLVYSDGVRYLAEHAACYWLLDIVWSLWWEAKAGAVLSAKRDLVCTLTVDLVAKCAVFHAKAWDDSLLYTQVIAYTDFPLEAIMLYVSYDACLDEHVILLPSED